MNTDSKSWHGYGKCEADVKSLWNKRSHRFADMDIPNKDDAYVSLILETSNSNIDRMNVLDIGCGSGIWSLAFADVVNSVIGIDIADKMIEYANEKADSIGLTNAKYFTGDWKDPSLDLGQSKFDIVMAHMTPAISSDDDLIRMDAVCDGYCYLTSSIKGDNDLRQTMEEHFGVNLDRDRRGLSNALRVLFEIGRKPLIRYEERIHDKRETVDDVVSFYKDTAVSRGISEKDLEEFLNGVAVDGVIESALKMTKATLYWNTAE